MRQKLWDWLKQRTSAARYVEAVYVREDREQALRSLWRQRARGAAVLFVAVGVVVVLYATGEVEPLALTEGKYLERAACGETVSMTVTGQADGNTWKRVVSLPIGVRDFTPKEREKLDEKTAQYLRRTLPGDNESLDQVRTSLSFPVTVPDTDIVIEWTVDDAFIRESGQIRLDKIPENGIRTDLMAEASWRNWKKTYHFPVYIAAGVCSPRQRWYQQVQAALQNCLKQQASKEKIVLPDRIGDLPVSYDVQQGERSQVLVYVAVGCFLLLPLVWRQQQKRRLDEREKQLLLDHPGIIHKFMLLLGAGLTVRKVVERLVSEYEQQREEGGEKRYAYEELCVLLQEMKDGVSEGQAVERFGRRCRVLPYMRFASLITQNMKKGAEGLLSILEIEALAAWDQRKERALQLGEKAGTKLLFPMMLMLGIVMSMIMVPAFMTM